jgi:L-ascorbate metabolism protein UlaG (beta-lactamase superfamily)
MQLTKFGHSCVGITDGDRSLVLDPGGFSDVDAALDGASAVLVTHEHADHVDVERLRAAARSDSALRIWAPSPVVAVLDVGEQASAVGPGESFDAAGFAIRTFGGQHALIHPLIPLVPNVGYVIDGKVCHPGDSLVVPPRAVSTLLLPAVAPWSKAAEVIDYTIAVRASRVLPIHDAIVTDAYRAIIQRNIGPIAEPFGIDYRDWDGPITV